jgi:hypothetical protein
MPKASSNPLVIIILNPCTATYAEAARLASIQSDARAHRIIHHKHADKFAPHALLIRLHAKKRFKPQLHIKTEAAAVASADCKDGSNRKRFGSDALLHRLTLQSALHLRFCMRSSCVQHLSCIHALAQHDVPIRIKQAPTPPGTP